MSNNKILEICCDSIASAQSAERGGANRLELCENLAQGGVTPSAAKIKLVKTAVDIPVFVLIRPRKGDFLYTEAEFQVMLEDIAFAKQLGADGIVSGALLADGRIDDERTRQLLQATAPLPFTFHRAIDVSRDPLESLQTLMDLGVPRVLTSGGAPSAGAGMESLQQMAAEANGRITLLVGGGVRPDSLRALVAVPGLHEFHSSAGASIQSQMTFRGNTAMGKEAATEEFTWQIVDEEMVRKMSRVLFG